jgi:hypothetical protein
MKFVLITEKTWIQHVYCPVTYFLTTGVPLYPWVTHSKSYCGYMKPLLAGSGWNCSILTQPAASQLKHTNCCTYTWIPPNDGQSTCSKHVEVEWRSDWRSKLKINSASSWLSLQRIKTCSENHVLINSVMKNEELPPKWMEYHYYSLHTELLLVFLSVH